jgi:hypothetical protein
VTSAVVLAASVHLHRKCPADPAAALVVRCHSAPLSRPTRRSKRMSKLTRHQPYPARWVLTSQAVARRGLLLEVDYSIEGDR